MEDNETLAPEWEASLCQMVMTEWERGDQYKSDLNDLYDDIYDMMRGERPEKNYDWQSNVVINKIFQVIWTAIPFLTNKIFSANPIIGIVSPDNDGATDRENILQFFNTMQSSLGQAHTDYFLIMVMWLLRGLLNGVGINKKTWYQQLKTAVKEVPEQIPIGADEEGNITETKDIVRKERQTIPIADWPKNEIVNNKDIVVDWLLQPGQSMRHGRFVIHRSIVDLDSLRSSKINYINLDELSRTASVMAARTLTDHDQNRSKDGQETPPESDMYTDVEIYERVGKVLCHKEEGEWRPYTHKEDIEDEPTIKHMVVTVAKIGGDGGTEHLVRFEPNPYDEINYIDMHIFFDEERWNSMGMAEPIKDLQTAINDNINAVFDETWQNLMAPAVFNKFALWDWDTVQYAPGQKWMVGGDPRAAVHFKEPTYVTRDAWQKHALLDGELQQTSVSNAMQGMGKEKTATTNVMNAQLSAGKLDFVLKMVEKTALIPSAQMDIAFAKKFAHPLTFQWILGKPFNPGEWEDLYKYVPAASSVKLDEQKDAEIQQDIQLISILQGLNNPNTAKLLNKFIGNILKNRGYAEEAKILDEEFFEPGTAEGRAERIMGQMKGPSNEHGIEMSGKEAAVRGRMNE